MSKGIRLVVSGCVQGVSFRWSVSRIARSLGVEGTVRNLPDGKVEIVCRCPLGVLPRFDSRIMELPLPIRVESIFMEECELPQVLDGFRIVG